MPVCNDAADVLTAIDWARADERAKLADRLRLTAWAMYRDDTGRRLESVLEECDRADLDSAWLRLVNLQKEWELADVVMTSDQAAEQLRAAMAPRTVERVR